MSVLNGPGEGTWSVFAFQVAEQRDALARELAEARADVEKLRELLDENAYERGLLARRMTEAQARRDEAYRRGAEAMREACMGWCKTWENEGEAIADALADLSIPEEP